MDTKLSVHESKLVFQISYIERCLDNIFSAQSLISVTALLTTLESVFKSDFKHRTVDFRVSVCLDLFVSIARCFIFSMYVRFHTIDTFSQYLVFGCTRAI